MRRVKFYRCWLALGAMSVGAMALGSATGVAAPRSRGGDTDLPDAPGDGPDDTDDRPDDPVERPPRQPTKPTIPGYVLVNDAYYREATLPLCEWGQGERSFHDQFIRQDGDQKSHWTCLGTRSYDPETHGYLNDTCSFSGPPDFRPLDAVYTLVPFDWWEILSADLEWPNGTAGYGAWGIRCERNASSAALRDIVASSTFEGIPWQGSSCPAWPNPGNRSTLIAELVGGDVEHVRPAIVRAQANIGYSAYAGPRNIQGDLVLAIQVFGSAGWQDFKTVARTTGPTPSVHEVEATVPEGSFVRLQVRGTQKCHGVQYGDGYDIRNLRIQVEACIPDQTNPGSCL